jgi:hypothetical protein
MRVALAKMSRKIRLRNTEPQNKYAIRMDRTFFFIYYLSPKP